MSCVLFNTSEVLLHRMGESEVVWKVILKPRPVQGFVSCLSVAKCKIQQAKSN